MTTQNYELTNNDYKFYKPQLFNDHFENFKRYAIPKAQLIIADIPYNLGNNAFASNPLWYKDGDIRKGDSKLANTCFFDTDKDFKINNFFIFVKRMLKKSKNNNSDGALLIFCSFEQMFPLIEIAKANGFKKYTNFVFFKNSSASVLKANMKAIGNLEYALLFYRDKLPYFNNNGKMFLTGREFGKKTNVKRIHPTQKPINLLKDFIQVYTKKGDVVIDPVAGSGSTLKAAAELGRKAYGFEIKKDFYNKAQNQMLNYLQPHLF